jgi:hypothetical protein
VLGLGWYAVALAGWGERFVHEHLVGRYLRNLAGGLVTGAPYSPKPLAYHSSSTRCISDRRAPVDAGRRARALARAACARLPRPASPLPRLLGARAGRRVHAAEWKLRHYLLPRSPRSRSSRRRPSCGSCARRRGASTAREPRRRRGRARRDRARVAVAAGWSPRLSPSDRSTVDALLSLVPGRASGLVAAAGFVAGVLAVSLAWRAWAALVGVTAAAMICWMLVGMPALEQERSRRDSLKPFARTVATLRPPPAPLAFWRDTLRPVVVYVGRHVPTLRRRDAVVPGIALIVPEPDGASCRATAWWAFRS